jgi:hypothetical protein
MAKWGNGPGWTIDQAMEVLVALHPTFRENGYALAMHGSVSRDGQGNDLDLIAVSGGVVRDTSRRDGTYNVRPDWRAARSTRNQ